MGMVNGFVASGSSVFTFVMPHILEAILSTFGVIESIFFTALLDNWITTCKKYIYIYDYEYTKSSCEAYKNSILLPKLFWPTVRKNCSSDHEKL